MQLIKNEKAQLLNIEWKPKRVVNLSLITTKGFIAHFTLTPDLRCSVSSTPKLGNSAISNTVVLYFVFVLKQWCVLNSNKGQFKFTYTWLWKFLRLYNLITAIQIITRLNRFVVLMEYCIVSVRTYQTNLNVSWLHSVRFKSIYESMSSFARRRKGRRARRGVEGTDTGDVEGQWTLCWATVAEDCVTDDIRTAAAEPVIVSGRMRFSDVLRFEADGRTDRRTDGRTTTEWPHWPTDWPTAGPPVIRDGNFWRRGRKCMHGLREVGLRLGKALAMKRMQ